MNGVWQDLRYSVRLFRRAPGFTATAILVLALGIGINTAVFSVANALLFQPLGGPARAELTAVHARDAGPEGGYRWFSYPDFQDLRAASADSGLFASLAAQEMARVGVSDGAVTRKTYACLVSSGYFETLGVAVTLGRAFLPREEQFAEQPVVVVSRAYWTRGGRAARLGGTVIINNQAFTIVGVAPEGFTGTTALLSPEFWLPLGAAPLLTPAAAASGGGALADRSARTLMVMGRLRPGLSKDAAGSRLGPIGCRLREAAPAVNGRIELTLGSVSRLALSAGPRDDTELTGVLAFLVGMAASVLLIACLNLANMLLARGGARGREIAIRLALGGSRARVVRQLLTESMLLSAAGALVGLVLSMAGTQLLARTVAGILPLPIVFSSTPDVRLLAAAALFSVASTLVFGLGPAVGMSRGHLVLPMKGQAGRAPAAHRINMRNLLVVGQLALCLTLLTAAGLFVRGAFAASSADPGFPLDRGLVAATDASLAGYDEVRAREAYARVLSRLRRLPGVESVSLASSVPFGIESSFSDVRRTDGQASGAPAWAATVVVGADYFKTVGLRVLRGREFTRAEEDTRSAARPVIVDVPLANRLWPNADPLGQRLQVETDGTTDEKWTEPLEVVGVVAGVRDSLFDREPGSHLYLPFGSDYRGAMHIHAKLRPGKPGAEDALIGVVRREMHAADAGLALLSFRTLREHRDTSVYVWMARASANVFATFGLSALLLAVMGVYGVKAYLVSRRTREIGIRTALGASRADILALVLRDGLWLALAGLAAGLGLSVALAHVLASWIYGVAGLQPTVILAAGSVLGGAALLASYLPARRAMRLAPSVALRAE
jgi:predicted permease